MAARLILPDNNNQVFVFGIGDDPKKQLVFDEVLPMDSEEMVEHIRRMMSPLKTRFTVSVEGNIGSGKSTLLEHFSTSPNVHCLREPVERLTNIHGNNALENLYRDPKRWCFSFNLYAMLARVQMHDTKCVEPVKMLERSLFSTREFFVKNSHKTGDIEQVEYDVLEKWFDYLVNKQKISVDLFVYLRAPVDVCMERIRRRNRKEEDAIPVQLIKNLHALHEDWFMTGKCPSPVLVLDASYDLPIMRNLWEDQRTSILCGYH